MATRSDRDNAHSSNDAEKWIADLVERLADFRTRPAARRELLSIGTPAIPALAELLRHPIEGVRWSALQTLAEIDDPAALEALIEALNLPALRGQAHRLLQDRTEIDLPPDPGAWREWMATGAAPSPGPGPDIDALGSADTATMSEEEIIRRCTEGTNATVERDEGLYRIVIPLDRGRSQQVVVSFDTTDEEGEPTVYVYTECGPASPERYDQVFRRNLTIPYGRIAVRKIDGRDFFVMFHQTLRRGLNLAELRKVILSIAKEGDMLEMELTRQDVV